MAFDSEESAESAGIFLVVLPGVYAPQHDTQLLLAALGREHIAAGADILDLGTGSGVLAVRAAQLGGRVTAVDIARCAVATTKLNALLHHQRIAVRRADLASALKVRTYDLILCNPPYVPAPHARVPTRGSARAWDAGFRRPGARARVPLGPVLLSRLRWLREQDLMKANDSYEELVVIRAECP
ncbi:methyltransferase [Streptomyces sp. NBC_01707]|uniref:methyltransferase n=1 Tax=Streptomyces sp. NBC_01707 TaxID=2975914 RepID=UPI00352BE336